MVEKTDQDSQRLADLKDVYDVLQKDAKEMAVDLLDGVTMWRSASLVCFSLAALALAVGVVVSVYVGFSAPTIFYAKLGGGSQTNGVIEGGPKLGVIAITIFLFSVSALSAGAGAFYLRKFHFLQGKYSDLKATLQKLG
jgi:hypothetical protein